MMMTTSPTAERVDGVGVMGRPPLRQSDAETSLVRADAAAGEIG